MRRRKGCLTVRAVGALLVVWAVVVLSAGRAVAADELYDASGAAEIMESLDRETQKLLDQAGAGDGGIKGVTGQKLFDAMAYVVREKVAGPIKAICAILAVTVLTKLCGCFEEGETSDTARLVGAIACTVAVAGPVIWLMTLCQRVTESAAAFLGVAAPVYAGLMTACGGVATGSGYSFLTMLLGEMIPVLSAGFILPLLRIYLGLSVVSVLSEERLSKFTGSIYGFMKWTLVTAVTIYSGVLSVQAALNSQVDAASGKAVKLALSTGVPVVGGALGDAVAAIQNSLKIVKSGAGAFGVLAALCIFLPAGAECLMWSGVCMLGQAAGDLFALPKVGEVLGAFASTVKLLLGVIVSVCAVCVASAAAIIFIQS